MLGIGVIAMSACAEETPQRAIYALAHDLEHDDYDGACRRLYPSSQLSQRARSALGIDQAPSWAPDGASCRRAFERGSLSDFTLVEPRVRAVRTRSISESRTVMAVATAEVAIDGRPPVEIRLADVDGRWRVVPTSD